MEQRDRWEELLRVGAERLHLALDGEAVARLLTYLTELSRWNRKINLVSRDSDQEAWVERHLLDSLTPLGMGLIGEGERFIDLGAGAGFPGLPLGMARPSLDLSLAEADARKCSFLRHVIRTTRLARATVLQGRFDELARDGAGGFDLAVSRAAAHPEEARDVALSFLRPGGRAILWVAAVPRGTGGEAHGYTLPFSGRAGILWEVRREEP